jgi:hypothetical protein
MSSESPPNSIARETSRFRGEEERALRAIDRAEETEHEGDEGAASSEGMDGR